MTRLSDVGCVRLRGKPLRRDSRRTSRTQRRPAQNLELATGNVVLSRPCSLRSNVERVDRLTRGHEETISFWAAEGDVAAHFRNADSPKQLAGGIPDGRAAVSERASRIARSPHIALDVASQAIRATLHAVDRAVAEQLVIRELVVRANIERIDFALASGNGVAGTLARACHIELLEVRREGEPIRIGHLIFGDDEIDAARGIDAVDACRQFTFVGANSRGLTGLRI